MQINRKDYDIDGMREDLRRDRTYIDCGETNEERVEAVRAIHDLGFRMGGWYQSHLGPGSDGSIRWRYLYMLKCDFGEEMHMVTELPCDCSLLFPSIKAFLDNFSSEQDDEEPLDLRDLYDWLP